MKDNEKEKAKFKESAKGAKVYATKESTMLANIRRIPNIWYRLKRIIKPLLRSLIVKSPTLEFRLTKAEE